VADFFENRAGLDAQLLARELQLRHSLWQTFVIQDEVTSTNDLAKEKAINEGDFFLANFQIKGRGRQDRSWEAPKNSSIFISFLLKPSLNGNINWITLMIGLSLARCLEQETGKNIRIKWPNDLVLLSEGKQLKFAGILSEKYQDKIIVGIGINFNQSPEELPIKEATSLRYILKTETSKEALIASFITELSAMWFEENNAQTWPTESLVREYKQKCITIGQMISAKLPNNEILKGQVTDISLAGELVLETAQGIMKLNSAEIHLEH
jgi:BirA family biotin operon repressor/biotin-[acetyl-CoA-carboxylase] ligase